MSKRLASKTVGVRGVRRTIGSSHVIDASKSNARQATPVTARQVHRLLPQLQRRLQGRCLSVPTFRILLRRLLPPPGLARHPWKLPTQEESLELLRRAAASRPTGNASWNAKGTRYVDSFGGSDVSNVAGYVQRRVRGNQLKIKWHEYGARYRLREVQNGRFEITYSNEVKTVGCIASRKTMQLKVRSTRHSKSGKVKETEPSAPRREVIWDFEKCYWSKGVRPRETIQCRTLVLDPLNDVGVPQQPKWSIIYLHMFSLEGMRYEDFPHYFNAGTESIRIVCPTAPCKPQGCFQHWKEWNRRVRKYKHVRFRSWFDYLTDKVGRGENEIDFATLFETRRLIHAIIDQEVKRVGDPRRVILGGASQGCCMAIDAAFTYPGNLGGVIGLVGHLLGNTPLDPSKKSMPVHLFHETTDKEMNWKNYVSGTVKRMKSEGFNVISTRERDPSGCGHNIGEIEGQWIRRALRQITSPGS